MPKSNRTMNALESALESLVGKSVRVTRRFPELMVQGEKLVPAGTVCVVMAVWPFECGGLVVAADFGDFVIDPRNLELVV